MTRYLTKKYLYLLKENLPSLMKNEDIFVLEDMKEALDFAIADINTLQDILYDIKGISMD